MRTMVQAGVRLCPDQVTIITIVLRVCAHVCTRVHEENRCESLCLWGFWSFRFGNRTAVLQQPRSCFSTAGEGSNTAIADK